MLLGPLSRNGGERWPLSLRPICMVLSRFVDVERMKLRQKISVLPMSEPRETLLVDLASIDA